MAARTTDAPPWLTARVWAALHGLVLLRMNAPGFPGPAGHHRKRPSQSGRTGNSHERRSEHDGGSGGEAGVPVPAGSYRYRAEKEGWGVSPERLQAIPDGRRGLVAQTGRLTPVQLRADAAWLAARRGLWADLPLPCHAFGKAQAG